LQLKLFGSMGPTPAFKRDLGLLLGLEDSELKSLADWFNTAAEVVSPSQAEVVALAADFSLNPEELSRVIGVVRFVLNNWGELGISLGDIDGDLKALGYEIVVREKIGRFFEALQDTRSRVHLTVLRRAYETSGLPTIDDASLLWDIRPIFSDFAYSPESKKESFTEVLDYAYLLILELEASRVDGRPETVSFQLSERDFAKLADAVDRAKQQLEALKSSPMKLRS
jgi:hypothetical protein